MKKFLLTLCLAVASVTLFSGCSKDDEDKLVGTWDAYQAVEEYNGRTFTETIKSGEIMLRCMEDGTFTFVASIEDYVDVENGKYSVAGDLLILKYRNNGTDTYTIEKLTKSELVISESYDDGKYTVYFRKK
ncbi:MAG: lipocalin family protein [Coprobacter sp.]|nr:lipocalin family protein [Coprobacter sp.]